MFSCSSSSRSCVAFRFVLFVVLICFRFGFLQFFLPHPPRPLCKYSSSSSGSIGSSLPALPAFHLYLSHSRSHFLSLSCVRSQLQQNQSKESKGTRRQSPSTSPSLSASQPQNEQNFFVFLWGVSNNFWLIELLIKLIEMQREAATATTLVNKNNVDWIKYFKAYCTGSERERERVRQKTERDAKRVWAHKTK